MKKHPFRYAEWICPHVFEDEAPVDVLHRANVNAETETPEKFKNLHMIVRRTLTLHKDAKRLMARISADDYYKLYLNGTLVCQGPAQGYYFAYNYNEVDITEHVRDGENEILVDVYYQGLINRAYNSGDRRMGMAAEIYQGEECVLSTDTTWEYAMSEAYTISHTMGYDTMFAENYDSRKRLGGWRPCCIKKTDYTFSDTPVKVVSAYEKEPVSVSSLENGATLLDFGEEITAVLRLRAKGKVGDRIRILWGEELEDTPLRVRYNMRCNVLADEIWTLDDGECTLEQYDYRAFRYVALVPDDGVEITVHTAIVRHYPFDDGYCNLQTESALLRDIFDMCKRTVKYGSQEVFVDCPIREKGQYAGDMTVTSASHVILTGDLSLLRKAIDNQMQSKAVFPGLLAVTPGSFMQEFVDYSLQFPILALRYYSYSSDKEYLKECLDVCENMLDYFSRFEGEDGLLTDMFDMPNLVDWPVNLRDGYDFDLSSTETGRGPHNVLNAFYIGFVGLVEQMRDILGISYEKRSDALVESFRRVFYREELGLYVDSRDSMHASLHSNAIVAFYGINRAEEADSITRHIMAKGLSCGVYMAYFTLKGLCRMGKHEEAYTLLVNESEHSWYNMLKEGATTCFEAWGKEQKWNTSLCHPWATAPISVLAEDILPNMPHLGKIVYSAPFPREE